MALAASPKLSSTSLNILIIDDNEQERKYWSDSLKNQASTYSIVEASDPQSGVGVCREQRIDCVVLDLDMPESSGFEFLVNMKLDRKRPPIPVVILSRLTHPYLFEIAMRNGAQACLAKQRTSPQELDDAIQKAMAHVNSARQTS